MKLKKYKIPKNIERLLWEYNINENDFDKIERIIIERVLQFGDSIQIKWLLMNIGYKKILEYFTSRGWQVLSNINYNFWFLFLKDFRKNNIDWQIINNQRLSLKKKNKFWKY